jgi:tetratricopeptide (TPR) repeat protein
MLTEMVFERDEAIAKTKFWVTSRVDGAICAWTVSRNDGGEERVLWMKAAPVHDAKGAFVAVIGSVKDITTGIGQELLRQARQDAPFTEEAVLPPAQSQGQVLGRLMGKARSSHREGLRLSYREGKYAEAIGFFDRAIAIDPSLAAAWHDRGVCLRELGRDGNALRSFATAVELAPDDEEFLFSSAGILRRTGILRGQQRHLEAAAKVFEHIVEINPNHAEAWNGLAGCMKDLGNDMLARQYFERANGIIRQNKAYKKVRNLDALV